MLYPVFGSALPATSGTMRPGPCGATACQGGIGVKMVEKPPPVPLPLGLPGESFQTVSSPPPCGFLVPPQPMTKGDDEGRSTLAGLGPPSEESLSPADVKMVMPAAVAACAAALSLPA